MGTRERHILVISIACEKPVSSKGVEFPLLSRGKKIAAHIIGDRCV